MNIDKYVDAYISSHQVSIGKPYPYMIFNLMEQLKITKTNEIIKIGDSPNDMKEGRNANCF